MMAINTKQSISILLVDDNPGDVRLTREALKEGRIHNMMYDVGDGIEAMDFLRRIGKYTDAVRPDLILLDINLPKKSGLEVLEEIKADSNLRTIPIVMLTTSQAEQDIVRSYSHHANAYVTKPVDLEQFILVIQSIEGFWLEIVKLPPSGKNA